MKYGSLFSGIGGLDLGLEEATGAEPAWLCEIDPFARAVLAHHWPGVRIYEDVREATNAERVDIICGGFPCQPVSVAGKRKAQADTRWLWPFFANVVARLRPSVVFIENVSGLRTAGLRDVLADLADLGFDAEWGCFSAAEAGAPHRRRRLFLLAHAHGARELQPSGELAEGGGRPGDGRCEAHVPHTAGAGLEVGSGQPGNAGEELAPPPGDGPWAIEPDVGRVAHGVPARMDRLRCLGNAVVPQQAALAWRELTRRFA